MDEVDRAIAKFDQSVMLYETQQPSSVGDYSRRGSTTSFSFNWRSPLGLLQKKKKEPLMFTVMTREAQMESVIFDFTDDEDARTSFRNLTLTFLDDENMETGASDDDYDSAWDSGEFELAEFEESVGIHRRTGSPTRYGDDAKLGYSGKLRQFGKSGSSIGVDVTHVMPLAGRTETPQVAKRPRRRSLNPVSWWRY